MSDIVNIMAGAMCEKGGCVDESNWLDVTRAGLSALSKAGYAVVPRVPTAAMVKAALTEADKHGYLAIKGYYGEEEAIFGWTAMLAAASPAFPALKEKT